MMKRLLTAFILVGLLGLLGCGGGHRPPASARVPGGTTSASLTIGWPSRDGRLVPLAAESITVAVAGPFNFATAKTVNRPDGATPPPSTISFPTLPTGQLTITAAAYPQPGGLGVAQARATTTVTAAAGVPVAITLVMQSTITQVTVTPAAPIITIGDAVSLTATALNANGAVVLVSTTAAYTWTSSNPVAASVDADGQVTAHAPGTVTITATERESGISGTATCFIPAPPGPANGTALVLYDTTGAYGWAGELYAIQLGHLLNHCEIQAVLKPATQYQAGDLTPHGSLFYLGNSYDEPLPDALLQDVLATTKPVCWMGYNAWQLSFKYNAQFRSRFGIDYHSADYSNATSITVPYNGQTLVQDPMVSGLTLMQVTDPAKAAVLVTCNKDGRTLPYVVRGGNFWHFAANPFLMVGFADKYLVFADLLHDIVNVPHPTARKAIIRVEDIAANSDPAALRALADVFARHGVPFGICVIPRFRDPLNLSGYGTDISLADRPQVVAAIQYMVSKGGQIVQHGYTHQYGEVVNPYNGVSGDDFEFFRLTLDGSGNQVMEGPVPEDSFAWALERVQQGRAILDSVGLPAVAWNTPHYLASDVDYQAFRQEFTYCLDRGLYFTSITGAQPSRAMLSRKPGFRAMSDGQRYYMQQMAPYPFEDCYGLVRLPETIAYVDPSGTGYGVALPPVLIQRAQAMLAVRDGWAGMYFHWYLDPDYLDQLLTGIKGLGYQFVAIPE